MKQYSCKLLFQWNPSKGGEEYRTRRVCEERIYTFPAKTPKQALSRAKNIGKEEAFSHKTEIGRVKFQFVGVLELIELIDKEKGSEVWYQVYDRVVKNGKFDHLIPKTEELAVFKKEYKRKLVPW